MPAPDVRNGAKYEAVRQYADRNGNLSEYTMLKMLKNFYRDFGLAKFPNITVGTEAHTYLVQRYYQVRTTPYIAIYNKKGTLVRAYDKVPAIDNLVAAVKKG